MSKADTACFKNVGISYSGKIGSVVVIQLPSQLLETEVHTASPANPIYRQDSIFSLLIITFLHSGKKTSLAQVTANNREEKKKKRGKENYQKNFLSR